MKRRDGYLVIDDCERIEADRGGHYWVYIDDVEYYFKPLKINNIYNELLAYYAANILGIEACYCDLALLDGEYGYISKSLRNDKLKLVSGDELLGDYLAGAVMNEGQLIKSIDVIKDMGIDNDLAKKIERYGLGDTTRYFSAMYINNLEVIWQALEYRYKDNINIKDVMNQFVSMYMFTIIFNDIDRHPGNWMIMESREGIKLAPLFDNECILGSYEVGVGLSTNFSDYEGVVLDSLKVFFNISASEYFDLFVERFDKMVSNFEVILQMVEKQIERKIPEDEREKLVLEFGKNTEKIRSMIDGFVAKRQR